MTLEDKITYFLHCEWAAGDEVKRASLDTATAYIENIWETIKDNPDEGYTVDGLIKAGLVIYVDAEANDEDLTEALEAIIKAHEGAA